MLGRRGGVLPEVERLLDERVTVHHHILWMLKLQYIQQRAFHGVSLWWQPHFKVLNLFFSDLNMLVSWVIIINSSWLQLPLFWKNGRWKQPLQCLTELHASFSLSISLLWSDPTCIHMGFTWIYVVFDSGYVSGKAGNHIFKSKFWWINNAYKPSVWAEFWGNPDRLSFLRIVVWRL